MIIDDISTFSRTSPVWRSEYCCLFPCCPVINDKLPVFWPRPDQFSHLSTKPILTMWSIFGPGWKAVNTKISFFALRTFKFFRSKSKGAKFWMAVRTLFRILFRPIQTLYLRNSMYLCSRISSYQSKFLNLQYFLASVIILDIWAIKLSLSFIEFFFYLIFQCLSTNTMPAR